jgi:hypothetical protein
MKHNTFVTDIISANINKIHSLGIEQIGPFQEVMDDDNDVEFYIVREPNQSHDQYCRFTKLIQELLPSYNIDFFIWRDIDMRYYEHVISYIHFCH